MSVWAKISSRSIWATRGAGCARRHFSVSSPTSTATESLAAVVATNSVSRKARSELFTKEKKRQLESIPRLEKIEVLAKVVPEQATLLLNKNLSTPHDVARHLSEMLTSRSPLAVVNGALWDMHRPLTEDGTVELLHFHDEDPSRLNRVFWRSCSFMLGAAIEAVMNDNIHVELHSFPSPSVSSGSFLYDVDLKNPNWQPSKQELMVFSAAMHRMAEQALPFERLEVEQSLALEMFKDNTCKASQIPSIASSSPAGLVTLYRVGDHVDISRGPMIANTSFLGRRCTIAAAFKVEREGRVVHRFQGVALPKDVFLNHFAFGILEKRASKFNASGDRPDQHIKLA